MADQVAASNSIGVHTVSGVNGMTAVPVSAGPQVNVLPTPPLHPSPQTHFPLQHHYFPAAQPSPGDAFLTASHGYITTSYPDFGQPLPTQLPTPPGSQQQQALIALQQPLPTPPGTQQMIPHQFHAPASAHAGVAHIPTHTYLVAPHVQPALQYHYQSHSIPQSHMMQPHDPTGQFPPPGMKPRVTTTLWEDEGTLCFQVEAKGVCVARREDNDMVNGTKLLNVAGMTRGRRDGILKSEKHRHVVKVGAMHLKGVWIPYERALDFANKEKIVDLLYPLFVADIKTFLYHPANFARTAQVMAAAERRRLESRTQKQQDIIQEPRQRIKQIDTNMLASSPLKLQENIHAQNGHIPTISQAQGQVPQQHSQLVTASVPQLVPQHQQQQPQQSPSLRHDQFAVKKSPMATPTLPSQQQSPAQSQPVAQTQQQQNEPNQAQEPQAVQVHIQQTATQPYQMQPPQLTQHQMLYRA
ncbi:hypothetical protein V1525DRAFT_398142 [Lipomyces kononenkoae]|uniref:Uncharacterized protein n=1 Tax=Lipomyces kononenkoae TaxID=34357 RepID=A0ACC3T6Y3_LIPKO